MILCESISSPHPYIFFNQDGMNITFVGFTVTKFGDLVNPADNLVIEAAIMTPQLYSGLLHNGVNFADSHKLWTKGMMIVKISTVMGVDFPYDPDETYVLTVDNVIKILAIQMRFRQIEGRKSDIIFTCLCMQVWNPCGDNG